jgi:hypothetical protein
LVACEDAKVEKKDVVYFGGNIINPVDSVVSLVKANNYSDTLYTKLDKDNFFLFKLDSLVDGTYTFHHGEEFQYVYLEQHDSLMIRLNTLEFDESLVFTGKGSTVNNYLIKRYLINESSNINLVQLFSLGENDFRKKIDSLKLVEINLLEEFNFSGSDFSANSLKWVNEMLLFTEYGFKEIYPYNNALINKRDSMIKVDSSFYAYRDNIVLNDSTLFDNVYFRIFLNSRMSTLTLDSLFKVVPESKYLNSSDNEYSEIYGNIRRYYIDSIFSNKEIKNYLYYRYYRTLFDSELGLEDLKKQLIPFFENVTDKKMIDHINHLLSRYIKLLPGAQTPDFEVFDGEKHTKFSSYFGKPIYLFFWLSKDRYTWNNDLTKDFNKLKKEFPNIQFISVYIDFLDTWKESMQSSGANGIQLSADYEDIKRRYLIPTSNSFVLIDSKGKIVEANASWPGGEKIKEKLRNLK